MRASSIACGALMLVAQSGGVGPPLVVAIPQQDAGEPRASPASASVSLDGRFVALTSRVRLAPADTNDRTDVYVLDRSTGAVTLESADVGDADCAAPRISADGRVVVFEVRPATPKEPAWIAIRNRSNDETQYVGRTVPAAWTGSPDVSADGRTVVFASTLTNLVPGLDANGAGRDVYLLDRETRRVERISVDSQGRQPAEGVSWTPSIAADGRIVAFISTADLDPEVVTRQGSPGHHQAIAHVFVRDVGRRATRHVDVGADGVANGAARTPALSADGRYVAFASDATNLAAGDRNRSSDVFVADLVGRALTVVSVGAAGGPANGASRNPRISADGRFVVFESDASDLLCARRCTPATEDINLVSDVFLFDRITRSMTRMSADIDAGWIEESAAPVIDGSGSVIAFRSRHPMDERDTAYDFDLFIRIIDPPPPNVITVRR